MKMMRKAAKITITLKNITEPVKIFKMIKFRGRDKN